MDRKLQQIPMCYAIWKWYSDTDKSVNEYPLVTRKCLWQSVMHGTCGGRSVTRLCCSCDRRWRRLSASACAGWRTAAICTCSGRPLSSVPSRRGRMGCIPAPPRQKPPAATPSNRWWTKKMIWVGAFRTAARYVAKTQPYIYFHITFCQTITASNSPALVWKSPSSIFSTTPTSTTTRTEYCHQFSYVTLLNASYPALSCSLHPYRMLPTRLALQKSLVVACLLDQICARQPPASWNNM